MKLKDYLHYYMGCKMIRSSHWQPQNEPYILHFEVIRDAVEFGDRPLLRRLEDMTEEEAIAIARLCFFDRDKGYPDSDFKARKVGIGSEKPSTYEVRIDNDWYDEVIKIGFITGNIWRCNGSTEHLHNQSQVFHYRIKQAFDLFGLIDANLAIDAKTLNP